MKTTTLTRRELNRATLARQMLLERRKTTALRAVEALVGLQAQLARPPFIGLWTRIEGFRRDGLIRLLRRREVVRGTAMRGTLHLMSARDFATLRPALEPVLSHAMRSVLRDRARGFDLDRVVAAAKAFFDEEPRTFEALRGHLARLHPRGDARAMGYAVRMHLPLVQVPTEAAWGYPGTADFAAAETWLGRPLAADPAPHALVLRYLAAFGPATAADAQAWSGHPGLGETFEDLRPKLRSFRDERGRELFDLPRAPRPAATTVAPVRFIPEYDNLVLSHADRTRLVADEHRSSIYTANLIIPPTFLVDGFVAGTWRVERSRKTATLLVEPFDTLPSKAREGLALEGSRLVRFIEDDAGAHDVRFSKPGLRRS